MNGFGDFDVARLEVWMRECIDGFRAPLTLSRFKGGQSNPTYLVTDAAGYRYVLRKKPDGELLPSAHAVDREFRVIDALRGTDVPVASARGYCDDANVIGTPFYVMDFVDGRILWDPALPGLGNAERTAIYDDMNRVVATLHRVDYKAVGLADYGRAGNFFDRQIGRWTKQYQAAAADDPIPAMERLIEWLPSHVPPGAQDETCIFHGDLRIDNMIFHQTESRVLAVLDWELSTLGHPLADFSYHLMMYRMPPSLTAGLTGVDLVALGLPDEAAYTAAYCRRTGRDGIANMDFYVAYNMFRLAAILHGIRGRVVRGTAASAHAVASGEGVGPLAELAWEQAVKAGA